MLQVQDWYKRFTLIMSDRDATNGMMTIQSITVGFVPRMMT